MAGRTSWLWLLVPLLLVGCAGTADHQSASNKVLATRDAYLLLQKNEQATAVYKAKADDVDSELICERVLLDGNTNIRTLCYTRQEMEHTTRNHRETFQNLTLFPGSGG